MNTRKGSVAAHIVMGLLAIYFLLPFWWLLVAATKNNDGLFQSASLWFSDFHLIDNLTLLFEQDGGVFVTWMRNSAFYAVVSGVGATVISALAGYAFAKLRFPGRNALFALLLGLIMVPATALVLPTYLLMSQANMVDTIWAVILPSLLNPFGVYLLRVYVHDSIPDEMLEAARIDGAGEFRVFTSVALPAMKPALVTVLLFSMVASWNNFFLPLVMLSDDQLYPLTVGLRAWYMSAIMGNGGAATFNVIVTGALVAIVPLIVAFLMLQRYWRGGLTIGSVK
ncbi:carbohydrate ABC transporter permease [Actinoplanes xinjiangensis]|jgi:multiple sugar transport system permease protein|uniref:Carbohydrate ABC transporter membrane protein 2 (CUT1 family) n=1 Tax=Actinoplanes xinjiangensis TaxID=512350 RepID=A0A316FTK8_9ACTN|nr:carbohydrate ABC transporter permease [Actinoplanes xinjiangensis]PWK51592.1 carbohydrate ABC transporter membrane protein 2 (CUT1 family) [Actinoplanes xinjiangensis]GIF35953.1 ABC transporter permease [Actinoplanes xinjiangensis]